MERDCESEEEFVRWLGNESPTGSLANDIFQVRLKLVDLFKKAPSLFLLMGQSANFLLARIAPPLIEYDATGPAEPRHPRHMYRGSSDLCPGGFTWARACEDYADDFMAVNSHLVPLARLMLNGQREEMRAGGELMLAESTMRQTGINVRYAASHAAIKAKWAFASEGYVSSRLSSWLAECTVPHSLRRRSDGARVDRDNEFTSTDPTPNLRPSPGLLRLIAGGEMKTLSRRDLIKTSLLAPAAVAAAQMGPLTSAIEASVPEPSPQAAAATPESPNPAPGRERLLLDFGWRFHFGHADDPARDFGFGSGRTGNFQKTGSFLPAGNIAFDDSEWRPLDLPHDWAIELPFENDPALSSKGYYPLGRTYPATSVGWYRRVFELSASDAGKRITIEFDGSYRETMVVFNGFYIGRHSGGYDPFSFDVTDFANPGGRNVLLVRVDATMSDGWFYEGAGIYRHVWLVKTHPVHVKQWGTFVTAEVRSGDAPLSIRTDVINHAKSAQNARVVSTILDPSGKPVGKTVTETTSIPERNEHTFEQKIVVNRPQLWSLEERNLYKLVTEVQVGRRASSIAMKPPSASAPSSSTPRKASSSTASRSSSRAPAITRTTPESAPPCPTPSSTTASASCRRWAATPCAPRTTRPQPSYSTPATSSACWSSTRRA